MSEVRRDNLFYELVATGYCADGGTSHLSRTRFPEGLTRKCLDCPSLESCLLCCVLCAGGEFMVFGQAPSTFRSLLVSSLVSPGNR